MTGVAMKPHITFECTNDSCPEYGELKEIQNYSLLGSITDEASAEYSMARFAHCPKCYRDGKLEIEHAGKSFSHIDALGEHLGGLAREAKLLRKLVANNLADEEEQQRYKLHFRGSRGEGNQVLE